MANSGIPDWLTVIDDDLRQVTNNLHRPMPLLSGAAYHRLKKALGDLSKLTPYGVTYRYPAEDEWEVPTAATLEGWKSEIEAIRSTL